MRKTLIGLAALAGVAIATPAMAQHWGHGGHGGHWGGGPHFGFSVGVPGPYGDYGYACGTTRERIVTPSGRVIYRYVDRC
jgi:hypothetical protein